MLYCKCLTVSHTHGMAVWDYTASRCVSFVSFPCWGSGGRTGSLLKGAGSRGRGEGWTVESLLKSIIRRHDWYTTSAPSLDQPLYPPTSTPPPPTTPFPKLPLPRFLWKSTVLEHTNAFQPTAPLFTLWHSIWAPFLALGWGRWVQRGSDLHYFFFKNLQRGTMITTLSNPATNTRLP